MVDRVSIGPGAESVGVELYAATTVDSRWDRALWDGQTWDAPSWEPVECEVLEASYRWGAGSEAGVLSIPDAGAMDLRTYDPDRLLDPLASSSPFFGSIRPGTPVRLVGKAGVTIPGWTGYLDEARYELASAEGRLRAVDGIAYLAQAEVPEGTALPNALRARVRAVVVAVGLTATVPVQPDQTIINLAADGSFEAVPTVAWIPANAGAGSGSLVTAGTPDGTRALKVVGGAGGASYRQTIVGTPVPGVTYSIQGYVSRPTGAAFGQLVVTGRNLAGAFAGPTTTLTGSVIGGWELLAGTWVCPADGSVASVEVWCQSSALATDAPLFDQVQLWGPDPDAILPDDPAVAAHDGKARAAWSVIQDAALDALTYVWLDGSGVLRFTPWGSLPDATYAVGCDDGTGGAWIAGIASLEAIAQADGIRNSVRSWASANTFGAAVKDPGSLAKYGERRLDAARIIPAASVWAQRILDDRADSGLEVTLGELRPYNNVELALLLDGELDGPARLRVRDDDHGELVDLTVAIIGGAAGVTPNGWRFRYVTMIPRAEWDQEEPPAPEPPIPPPDPFHTETRTYIATSDALIALTSGGAKYGAGASSSLPVGAWSGWSYRGLVQFPAIPWTKIKRIVSATIILRTTTAMRVGFGSSPTIELKRITGSWSAGSSSSPSSGNAVVWPGPAVTGSVRSNVTASQSTTVRIRVDSLVLPWAPTSVGGTLAAQRGLALYGGSGSQADTTEFYPVEKGGTDRPTLELVLEVFD